MSVQKRREELTTLNLLFCLMVLWSHCSGHPITVLDHSSWQYGLMISLQRLTFVSVSGFFFLSGVKLTLNSASAPPPPLGRYWAKRWKGIFLPYLLAVAVYYVYFVSHGYFSFSLRDLAGYMIRGDLSSPFYFVIALGRSSCCWSPCSGGCPAGGRLQSCSPSPWGSPGSAPCTAMRSWVF